MTEPRLRSDLRCPQLIAAEACLFVVDGGGPPSLEMLLLRPSLLTSIPAFRPVDNSRLRAGVSSDNLLGNLRTLFRRPSFDRLFPPFRHEMFPPYPLRLSLPSAVSPSLHPRPRTSYNITSSRFRGVSVAHYTRRWTTLPLAVSCHG
jgi:hypothetical protein